MTDEARIILDWLKGVPVHIEGKVYIFPHGVGAIQALVRENLE